MKKFNTTLPRCPHCDVLMKLSTKRGGLVIADAEYEPVEFVPTMLFWCDDCGFISQFLISSDKVDSCNT